MMMNSDFLQQTFLGNTIENYLWFAGILLTGFVFKILFSKFISKVVFRLLKKYSKGVSIETFVNLLTKPVSFFIMLIILFLAFNRLDFPEEWHIGPSEKFGVRMVMFKLFQTTLIL